MNGGDIEATACFIIVLSSLSSSSILPFSICNCLFYDPLHPTCDEWNTDFVVGEKKRIKYMLFSKLHIIVSTELLLQKFRNKTLQRLTVFVSPPIDRIDSNQLVLSSHWWPLQKVTVSYKLQFGLLLLPRWVCSILIVLTRYLKGFLVNQMKWCSPHKTMPVKSATQPTVLSGSV